MAFSGMSDDELHAHGVRTHADGLSAEFGAVEREMLLREMKGTAGLRIRLHKVIYADEVAGKLKAWHDRELFRAQTFGFVDFLTASTQDRMIDKSVYEKLRSMMYMLDMSEDPTYKELEFFNQVRIEPRCGEYGQGGRRRFFYETGELKPEGAMGEEILAEFQQWRDHYTAVSRQFKWSEGVGHE